MTDLQKENERLKEEVEALTKASVASCISHARFIVRESVISEIEARAVEEFAELYNGVILTDASKHMLDRARRWAENRRKKD